MNYVTLMDYGVLMTELQLGQHQYQGEIRIT